MTASKTKTEIYVTCGRTSVGR